jgi:acetoin utilization protein AcuC
MSTETVVFVGEELSKYRFPDAHPVSSIDHQGAFWAEAVVRGLDKRVVIGVPRLATREELEHFHTPDYVSWVKLRSEIGDGYLDDRRIRAQRFGQEHQLQQHLRRIGNDYLDDGDLGGGDMPAFPGVFERGAVVSGTALEGLDRIMKEQTCRTFQPIGGHHHARPSSAAGFCVFNDLGVVIETLRARFGVQRVGYVDIDAHHGDGIYYHYETDPELIIVDIHEDGNFLYPGTGHRYEIGRGEAQGTKLNLPLRPGDGDGEFFAAWEEGLSHLRRYKPEFLILQCGADGLAGDPMTDLCYTPAVHARIACELRAFADEMCCGRLMAFGGGGYNPDNVVAAWTNTLTALI